MTPTSRRSAENNFDQIQSLNWELRIDDYRIFYDIEENEVVKVVAVGHKSHNDLLIRGAKVEL